VIGNFEAQRSHEHHGIAADCISTVMDVSLVVAVVSSSRVNTAAPSEQQNLVVFSLVVGTDDHLLSGRRTGKATLNGFRGGNAVSSGKR